MLLTYYLQETRGYSPVATGLAYLPMLVTALVISITSNVALLPRTGPKPLVAVGMLLAAGGMVWLTRIGLHSGYAAAILGPLLISGAGMGLVVSPAMNTATFGVPPADAGVASATANTQQQIGTSIGTALLNTLAVSATTRYLITHTTAVDRSMVRRRRHGGAGDRRRPQRRSTGRLPHGRRTRRTRRARAGLPAARARQS
jgi:hypothetical protein